MNSSRVFLIGVHSLTCYLQSSENTEIIFKNNCRKSILDVSYFFLDTIVRIADRGGKNLALLA